MRFVHLTVLAGASAFVLITSQAQAESLLAPSGANRHGATPARTADSAHPSRFTLRLGAQGGRVGDFGGASIRSLAAEFQFTQDLIAGISYGRARQGQTDLGFASDATFTAVSAYLTSRREDGEGLTWTLAYTLGQGDIGTYRFPGVVGAEMGYGLANMTSRRASVELGYGIRPNDRLLLSPFLRLSQSTVRRAAYTEAATIAFPLSFDAAKFARTTATLGLDLDFDVGARTVVTVGAGLDHDLNTPRDILTGTSTIPGFATFATAATGPQDHARLYATASLRHSFAGGSSILLTGSVAEDVSSASPYTSLGVTYDIRF